MTILVVLLLGSGAVLIASALDNQPIVATFQKIISGQKIDWTGGTGTPASTAPPQTVPKQKDGTCPSGYVDVNGTCTKINALQN